jgi:hypothetical protein
MENSINRHSAFTGIFPDAGENTGAVAKGNEISKIINGIPVTLRFSDTADERATYIAQDNFIITPSSPYLGYMC